jgi:hypothetical protein
VRPHPRAVSPAILEIAFIALTVEELIWAFAEPSI